MREKNYNYLRRFGYGLGYMTQAALLLDQMEDAEKFIGKMVQYCYLPRWGKWLSPEGIIVHREGRYYLSVNGYRGQDSHLADSTKALRLMLGVDDNRKDYLRLVPRFPADWTKLSVSDFPVLTGNSRQKLGYQYERQPQKQTFRFQLERPVSHIDIRLGPIPQEAEEIQTVLNGSAVPNESLVSGDSRWVWVRNLSGKSGELILHLY